MTFPAAPRKLISTGRTNRAQDLITGPYGSSYRIDGIEHVDLDAKCPFDQIEAFCDAAFAETKMLGTWQDALLKEGAIDFVIQDDFGRIRVHVARGARGHLFMTIRFLEKQIYTPEQLGLPPILMQWSLRRHGAILLGGLTDSGKTVAIASLVRELAFNRGRRVVTLEDTIEYAQEHPLILPKEIGSDLPDAERGVFHSKRERPDVIVFGELRSVEMIRGFVMSAESGAITIASTHLSDMASSLEALEAYFKPEERQFFRTLYARQFIGGVGMTLVRKKKSEEGDLFGRVLATEILVKDEAIRNNLAAGAPPADIRQLMIATETKEMRTLEKHLSQLCENQTIDVTDANDAALYLDDLQVAA